MALEETSVQNYRPRWDVCVARLVAIVAWSVYTTVNSPQFDFTMSARIYKPSKTAVQSGFANTKSWVLDFEPDALSSRDQ